MARDDSSAATIIFAFVLGTVTGAAVALLMAPASGEETRRKIGDKAREGADRAREVADRAREMADKARDVAGQGRDLWNRQRETIATAIERGREAYQQARGAQPPGAPSGEPL